MLPILGPIQKLQKFPVLLIPLIGIPGKSTGNRPDHQAIGDHSQNRAGQSTEKAANQANDQTGGQNHRVELIRAVPAIHKPLKSHSQIHTELTEPISKTIHKTDHLKRNYMSTLYSKNQGFQRETVIVYGLLKE